MDSDDERLPRFERAWAVGRVIRPSYLGDGDLTEGRPLDSASLRHLWGFEDGQADDEEGEGEGEGGGGEGRVGFDQFENSDEVLLPKRNALLRTAQVRSTSSSLSTSRDQKTRIANMQDRTG